MCKEGCEFDDERIKRSQMIEWIKCSNQLPNKDTNVAILYKYKKEENKLYLFLSFFDKDLQLFSLPPQEIITQKDIFYWTDINNIKDPLFFENNSPMFFFKEEDKNE